MSSYVYVKRAFCEHGKVRRVTAPDAAEMVAARKPTSLGEAMCWPNMGPYVYASEAEWLSGVAVVLSTEELARVHAEEHKCG